jgi:hypothetical protein
MPFFVGRLTPLATDRVRKTLEMSHIFIGAAGLTQPQIDAVPLHGTVLRVLWRRMLACLSGGHA